MYQRLARGFTSLVILLMSLQILGAAATSSSTSSGNSFSLHSKKTQSTVLGSYICEKAGEESEKSAEEKDRMTRVFLLDFSRLVSSLSAFHTPQIPFTVFACQYDVRPPLHQLYCVFLI